MPNAIYSITDSGNPFAETFEVSLSIKSCNRIAGFSNRVNEMAFGIMAFGIWHFEKVEKWQFDGLTEHINEPE